MLTILLIKLLQSFIDIIVRLNTHTDTPPYTQTHMRNDRMIHTCELKHISMFC